MGGESGRRKWEVKVGRESGRKERRESKETERERARKEKESREAIGRGGYRDVLTSLIIKESVKIRGTSSSVKIITHGNYYSI